MGIQLARLAASQGKWEVEPSVLKAPNVRAESLLHPIPKNSIPRAEQGTPSVSVFPLSLCHPPEQASSTPDPVKPFLTGAVEPVLTFSCILSAVNFSFWYSKAEAPVSYWSHKFLRTYFGT